MAKMQIAKATSQNLLKVLSKFVSSLSEDDIQGLFSGEARITVVWQKPTEVNRGPQKSLFNDDDPNAIEALKHNLRSAASADAAILILEKSGLTRVQLERIARSFDLSILKEDTVVRLIEKITEATVGSKLSSKAVRGR